MIINVFTLKFQYSAKILIIMFLDLIMRGTQILSNQFFKPAGVVFFRHGESTWNVLRRVQGGSKDPSIMLTDAGRAAVKAQLRTLPKPQLLICSPLLRCKQTAETWFDKPFDQIPIPTRINPAMAEINAGIYEGKYIDDLKNDPLWQQWMSNPAPFEFPEGETLIDFSGRILRCVGDICSEQIKTKQITYVITHGVAMRVIKNKLANQDLGDLWKNTVDNLEQIALSDEQIMQFHKQCAINDVTVSPKRL